MPLALATALQFTILIFHNCDNIPAMYVTPDVVTTEATAFVVYSYCNGLGHYDAAIPCHHVSNKSTEKKRCSCGINMEGAKQNCSPNAIYMTRCGCFKEGKPCTYLYMLLYELQQSKRSTYTDTKKAERIKRKHAFQIELPKSKKKLLRKEEKL